MQAMLLHGEQYLEVKVPLKATGRLLTTARVLEVQDKGKAAVVVLHTTSRCAESGEVVAENEITSFMRGAGGFGKQPPAQRRSAAVARNEPPRCGGLFLLFRLLLPQAVEAPTVRYQAETHLRLYQQLDCTAGAKVL